MIKYTIVSRRKKKFIFVSVVFHIIMSIIYYAVKEFQPVETKFTVYSMKQDIKPHLHIPFSKIPLLSSQLYLF